MLSFLFPAFLAHTEIAFAQAYVPVAVVKFDAFDAYVDRFNETFGTAVPNGTTDSLRDLISGSDPGGLAKGACAQGDNLYPAFDYVDGNWAAAVASSSGNIPHTIPEGGPEGGPPPGMVQINYSASLRCLLQEIVEWQKLGLSIQIHAMLKTYIADAQAKQLNNQVRNKIAAANLDWGKAGNAVDNNGVLSNTAVYNLNSTQNISNKNSRQLDHIADQGVADPAAGSPTGSLELCEPWRLDATANMVRNSRTDDPINFTKDATGCTLSSTINPVDWDRFSDNLNDTASIEGGLATFDAILLGNANSPLDAASMANTAAYGRIERQEDATKAESQASGFESTKECSGLPDDPHCLDTRSTAVSPGGQNYETITSNALQGDEQVANNTMLDGNAATSSELQSLQLNTQGGAYGYDATPIQTSQTSVNELIQEFYDTILYGYFGIDSNPSLNGGANPTTDWAQATMLMIYDEMKFNDTSTEVIVTQGTADNPTGYGGGWAQ
jgi:hypothetical protein